MSNEFQTIQHQQQHLSKIRKMGNEKYIKITFSTSGQCPVRLAN